MNRLIPRIDHARDCLSRRVRIDNGQPLPDDLDIATFERGLDNSPAEHYWLQSEQSRAHATGLLTTEEALVVHAALGEVPASNGWAAGTDLATKLIVIEAMVEISMLQEDPDAPQARH